MDLNNEKTDSGILNEVKNLMKKKSDHKPKKEDSEDDFDEMIQELENNQHPNQVTQPQDNQNFEELPSFNGSKEKIGLEKTMIGEESIPVEHPSEEISIPVEQPSEEIDMLVPAPPPELMQEKTPRLDVDRLMNVEEIYLNQKGKGKYGNFKIKEPVDPKKPIFIKVDNYEETLRKVIEVKANVSEFSEVLFRIENIKDSQTSNFSTLHNQLEDIQRKMIFIDTMLFEKL